MYLRKVPQGQTIWLKSKREWIEINMQGLPVQETQNIQKKNF